ncbi:DUF1217 domain-containing protein [Rhodoblastus acidophilus]|uniref:DUF1217 domain-containing protein n=1 Tax=Rhodoblastus acidophilus TaxID=1074 RepID=A0A6N8DQH8_RHOAC|nr:DUF1217 domain-containing protein [Rhodoblastus acidophilus]MCW2274985.1 hypothetical protein [Rhodoblastus acidophilus]MTV31431.1 DUF1217 domain-containing protein [Rhodoblastus acidophilus]
MTTFTDYLQISTHLSRYQKLTASDPVVSQATKYYKANIGKITSAEQLVKNTRLFNYVMNAFGLGDMTYAKKMIQTALEQGLSSSKALAVKLNNSKITALVKVFDFATLGSATTQQTAAQQGVVDKYVMQTLETNQGQTNPGVQLALYFRDHASSITDGYSVLADSNLLKVVQTTLGISSYTSTQNVDTQAARFDKLLKYTDFQDSAKVQKFLERFAAQYDVQNPSAGTSSASSVLSLFNSSGSSAATMSVSTLMSLQNLKLGGY